MWENRSRNWTGTVTEDNVGRQTDEMLRVGQEL